MNIPPLCAPSLDLLQRRLDGEAVDTPPAIAAHLAECIDCRERFAAIGPMLDGLCEIQLPLPQLMTERIVVGAIADLRRRRQMRRWSLAAAGLAAGVMVAVWLTQEQAVPSARIVQAPPKVEQEVTDAGAAVATLGRRTAADAIDAGRQIIPTVPAPPWLPTLEPTRPLDEAGVALANGFEPVATSARRAAQLFWHELPMTESKTD